MAELLSDPWGCDTVAQICFTGSGASRNDSTVNYQFSAAGFTGWVQIAEAEATSAFPVARIVRSASR